MPAALWIPGGKSQRDKGPEEILEIYKRRGPLAVYVLSLLQAGHVR